MPNNGLTASRIFLDRIAKRSFRWEDADKFVFLWGQELVITHADHNTGIFMVMTEHHTLTLHEIYNWLYNSREFILEEGEEYAPDRD